ncbi:MAG: aldose 1-epimerase [Actinobacteria bacterium]|nr:aldose 1-epimerase [Actinomycetota bacterium]
MTDAEYLVRRGAVPESGEYEAYTLVGVEAELEVSFVPDAGMVGCSLRSTGRQLLGGRQGIAAYVEQGKTFGIPLLAPWANRLGSDVYTAAGVTVDVAGTPGMHRDGNGYPIHGLLAGSGGWRVVEFEATSDDARLTAELDFDVHRPEFQGFPYPHLLRVGVRLVGHEVHVRTEITPTAELAVPIAFGWHPYFVIPDLPRGQWQLTLPFTRRAELNDHNLPTGEVLDWSWDSGPLGQRTVDDLFVDVPEGAHGTLAGGGCSIQLEYLEGYPYGVAFAPASDDVVAIEPMTAPTDPFAGVFPRRVVEPGDTYAATFVIRVTEDSP